MILDISPEAEAVLERKALALGATLTEVLNAMILEFACSTPDEIKQIGRKRDEARDVYLSANELMRNSLSTHFRAWTNGYKTGWKFFQIRKRSIFDLRRGDESHV